MFNSQHSFAGAGDDYTVDSPLMFNIASMTSGERLCVDVSTFDDTLAEGTEQFELSFSSIDPSSFANIGDPASVCVNISDNEGKSVCTCVLLIPRPR